MSFSLLRGRSSRGRVAALRPGSVPALALLAGVALTVSGCSDTMQNAATVTLPGSEGRARVVTDISNDRLEDDLRVLRDNADFMALVRAQSEGGPESDAAIERQLATLWLNTLIEQVVIDAEVEERDLEITDADREAVRSAVEEFYGGAEVFAKFPESFREAAIERSARWRAVQAAIGGAAEEPTEADARAFYEENFESIAACESGISVAHILVGTQEEAQAVADELAAGADFGELASQRSTDTVSAANGGDLGCYQAGSFVPEFEEAVNAAQVGVPSAPVESPYGWHVVLVTEYEPPTFEDLQQQILQYLRDQASQEPDRKVVEALSRRLAEAEVTVNARYGKWVTDEQGSRVEPPPAPNVRDQRRPEPTEQQAVDPGSLTGG